LGSYDTAIQGMQNISASEAAQPAEIRERRTAAEGALSGIQNDLGAPGTYGPPAAAPTAPPGPSAAPPAGPSSSASTGLLSQDGYNFANKHALKSYQKLIKKGFSTQEAVNQIGGDQAIAANSIFSMSKTGISGAGPTGGLIGQQTIKLDPTKAKNAVEGSSAFRQVSQMMAESEQMLSRSGPLYDEMMQSTQLPIIEGAAAAARENTENIRSAMARGGSARRDAFEAVQQIRAQDNINMQKGQQLAQAHLQMDQWVRDNAKSVINFSQNWSQNLAGIRESYQSAMDSASKLMASTSLPYMMASEQKAQEYREAQSAQQRGKVNRWITGILGVAEGVMTAYRGGDASGVNNQFNNISGSNTDTSASSAFQIGNTGVGVDNQPTVTYGNQSPSQPSSLMGDLQSGYTSASNAVSGGYNYLTGSGQ
jgi:hypothetical protein